ncbi:MAG: hypothetical protein KDE27_07705, partial [Planctomycetes bacterium]|nr:hypothetical protein [Planctomycetota bacterium]
MPSIYSRFAASFGQVLAIAALLPAQHTGAVDALDPLQLVSRAEARCRAGDTEDGILLLWRAIASLEPLASHPVRESALAAAHKLLAAHDPLDDARRETHALVARLQVGLAKAYRGRKWYETAAERLAVAARFDRSATTAESAALARV